jgi:Tol biopolymer transport system component
MTLFIKKHQLSMSIVAIALVAITLSACGNNEDIDLSGAAPGDAETEVPVNATEEVTPATEVPPTPIPPAAGRIIFISNRDGQNELYMTSPDGIDITRLTTNAAVDSSSTPRISPDGNKVAFSATVNDNTDIYILDIVSGIISRVTNAQEKDSAPSWSPNGQQLVFESFRDGNLEIYITNTDGSNQTRLTNDPTGDSTPAWSPISNEIVFVSGRFGNSDLLLLSPNGTVSTLTTDPAPNNTPTWSPDGNFIAFTSFIGELSNICIIGRDGLNQQCITTRAAEYSTPVWSPDGQSIAFNDQTNIQVFNRFSGEFILLSQAGVEPRGAPAWSPDGLRLVFQAQSGGDMEIHHALILTNEFTRVTSFSGYDGEPVWASR